MKAFIVTIHMYKHIRNYESQNKVPIITSVPYIDNVKSIKPDVLFAFVRVKFLQLTVEFFPHVFHFLI